MKSNVFVKPNEQKRACSSYAMARKRRMKSNDNGLMTDLGLICWSGFRRESGIKMVRCDECALKIYT